MQERTLIILYGSQTGTAEDVAKRIRKQAKVRRFITIFSTMNDFAVEKLIETGAPVIFICSTTGQGEEPDNMKVFWRSLLRRRLQPNSLTSLEFAVLGLGDSSYQYFNFPAKRLHKRLLRLGGTAIHELGLADDQHDLGVDGIVEPWIQHFFDKLMERYPLPDGVTVLSQDGPHLASYRVEFVDHIIEGCSDESKHVKTANVNVPNVENPCSATLVMNKRVTATDHFQDVRFLQFDVKGIKYEPGDVLNVFPKNQPSDVDDLLQLLSLNGESLIKLSINDEDASLPPLSRLNNPCSIRETATTYWDFQAVPRKSFFELLSTFAVDEREKDRLKEFASPTGTDELFNYCFRPKRTSLEVLQDFSDTCTRIPVAYWFDLFHPIQARSFSIASSFNYHPGEIHLLVAVVKYQTKLKKPRLGLCSNWLATLPIGTSVYVWAKKGSMKFDKVNGKPVVMVGPGTGVAPFRSFIYDRVCRSIGNSILFFGCRYRDKDYYFEEEWKTVEQKKLLTVHTAISRDQEEKIYVQHVMWRMSELVFDAIFNREGYFYVAGNSKNMPADVMASLKRILCHHGKMSMDEAEAYIKDLVKDGRYQTETWS